MPGFGGAAFSQVAASLQKRSDPSAAELPMLIIEARHHLELGSFVAAATVSSVLRRLHI